MVDTGFILVYLVFSSDSKNQMQRSACEVGIGGQKVPAGWVHIKQDFQKAWNIEDSHLLLNELILMIVNSCLSFFVCKHTG